MSEFLEKIEAKGRAEGKAEGRAEGKAEGRVEGRAEGKVEGELIKAKEMAISLRKQGIALSIIASAAGVSEDVVREWVGLQTA